MMILVENGIYRGPRIDQSTSLSNGHDRAGLFFLPSIYCQHLINKEIYMLTEDRICGYCHKPFKMPKNHRTEPKECCSPACGVNLRWQRGSFNRPASNDERFWAKVRKTDDCWIWEGNIRGDYGRFAWREGVNKFIHKEAHRVAYELTKGSIPKGLTIDHLCRNTRCVNPSHLEAVTQQVNNHRGNGPCGINHSKQHCKNGHPFIEGNFKWVNSGKNRNPQRVCQICKKQYDAERYAKEGRRD